MEENERLEKRKMNFQDIYNAIIDKVSNHITEIFNDKVRERIHNIGKTADCIIDDDLTAFYEEDEFGKIFIDGRSYNLDTNVQTLINIASYEAVKEQVNISKLSPRSFYDELQKVYKKNSRVKDIKTEVDYETKQQHIEFCARVGILNAILLNYKGMSIYKDIMDNRRQVKQEI